MERGKAKRRVSLGRKVRKRGMKRLEVNRKKKKIKIRGRKDRRKGKNKRRRSYKFCLNLNER